MKKVLIAIGVIVLLLVAVVMVRSSKKVSGETLSNELTATLNKYIAQREVSNPEVSQANVAWHLDHSLKVINAMSDSLIGSDPSAYEGNFNLVRNVVFTTGIIPRGAGKAPDEVKPPEVVLLEDLQRQLEIAQAKLMSLDDLEENSNYEHPVFGLLDRDQALYAIEIHTNHHLKIIKDILDE